MTIRRIDFRSRVAASADEVYAWHTRRGALERLIPPWEGVRILESGGGIENGSSVALEIPIGPLRVRWRAVHAGVEPGRQFRDEQEEGPFAAWAHTHRFEPLGPDASVLHDGLCYALPWNGVGDFLGRRCAEARLRRMFRYRHAVTALDLERHHAFTSRPPLSVAVSGASGFVGSALVPFLRAGGHRVSRLVRPARPGGPHDIPWNPAGGNAERLEGLDAVVHLAGEGIAGGRWTAARKARIRASRVDGTRILAETLAGLAAPPKVLLCASAIGIYGNRGEEALDETSARGGGFLADVCRDWEAVTAPAAERRIRVAHLRFGVILGARGGALRKMLPAFLLGGGGRIGSGRQVMSWISLDDVLGAILFALFSDGLSGPVNLTAPSPVHQAEFAHVLGGVLRRPAVAPLPAFVVQGIFGEMAEATLLAGARALPRKLLYSGFQFRHPELEGALRFELGRWNEAGA